MPLRLIGVSVVFTITLISGDCEGISRYVGAVKKDPVLRGEYSMFVF